jgi:hypothetical protein
MNVLSIAPLTTVMNRGELLRQLLNYLFTQREQSLKEAVQASKELLGTTVLGGRILGQTEGFSPKASIYDLCVYHISLHSDSTKPKDAHHIQR